MARRSSTPTSCATLAAAVAAHRASRCSTPRTSPTPSSSGDEGTHVKRAARGGRRRAASTRRSFPSPRRSKRSSPSCRRRIARSSSQSLGLESAGLDRLIRAGYHLLGLQTYFTAGEQEVRAWTIHRGDTAPQAAGVIHTDFERGFIRAETVGYDDFVANGGWKGAREKGVVRSEGKEYVVQDGDVMLFRFNV